MAAPAVHFVRALYGPHDPRHSAPGFDSLGYKRACHWAGVLPGDPLKFDETYGDKAVAATKKIQKKAGIPQTGHVGFATWEALRHMHKEGSKDWAFDALAIYYVDRAWKLSQVTPVERIQKAGVDAALFWILHKDESSYAQVRPIQNLKPPSVPRRADCSWHVTNVHFAAAAPDPNGRGYDGEGYTGTLAGHCKPVSIHDIDLLDLVFYGFTTRPSPAFPYGSPTHVAVYIGGGYVSSDGSNSGPEKRDIDYRPIHSVRRNNLLG